MSEYSSHIATHIKKWQMSSYDLWSNREPSVVNWNTIIGYDHSNVLCLTPDFKWSSKMVAQLDGRIKTMDRTDLIWLFVSSMQLYEDIYC